MTRPTTEEEVSMTRDELNDFFKGMVTNVGAKPIDRMKAALCSAHVEHGDKLTLSILDRLESIVNGKQD